MIHKEGNAFLSPQWRDCFKEMLASEVLYSLKWSSIDKSSKAWPKVVGVVG
jgi:hypothetical protein